MNPVKLAVVILVTLFSSVACNAQGMKLAHESQSAYVIVRPANATEPERFAAEELAHFLERVTLAKFIIVDETKALNTDQDKKQNKRHHIFVGATDYAADHDIDIASLKEEQWVIRTIGSDLVLLGGGRRGTMYAVYAFLEDQVGCYWLDHKTQIIPNRPTLEIGALDITAKPHFMVRTLGSPTGLSDDAWRFMVRNRTYRQDFKGHDSFFPKGAYYPTASALTGIHSFSDFVNGNDYFKDHPEYFALVNGKRLPCNSAYGPGQLCLTNKDVLQIALNKLRAFITQDRLAAKKTDVPPPTIYWFNQADVYHGHCGCDQCKAIVEREGGESGPLVTFVNALAEAIETEYPDILVGTLAYNKTADAPKHVRPRKNVLIGWCDVYSRVDGIKALSHPDNEANYNQIVGWGKVAPTLGIGDDYWTALSYYPQFPTPYATIDPIDKDLKLFAKQGAMTFHAEAANYMEAGEQFIPLKQWFAYQLLVDPTQSADELVKLFTDGYYGEAAGSMRAYLAYMRERIDGEAQFKTLRDEPFKLAYLDVNFFQTSQKLFDEAEAAVAEDSTYARHVHVERFTLDGALLFLWPWLERELSEGEVLPFDHEVVIKRYERGFKAMARARYSRIYTKGPSTLNVDGNLMDRMTGLFRDPQLPEVTRGLPARDVADFNWMTFSSVRPQQQFVADDEAVGGMAATFAQMSAVQRAEEGGQDNKDVSEDQQHRQAVMIGISGAQSYRMSPERIPQDEKYHLHSLGVIQVKPGTTIWALEGKRLGVNVDRVLVTNPKSPADNQWKAYISLKFQGPAYVKGSTKPNGVWMDRVLLVKPEADAKSKAAAAKMLQEEQRRQSLRVKIDVPALATPARGDSSKINWEDLKTTDHWWLLNGEPAKRDLQARFTHDGQWLYMQLTEKMDTAKLISAPDVWRGDDWEILFAAKSGSEPYRQIALNPEGKFVELAYGEPKWQSGVNVQSNVTKTQWTLTLAFPLDKLVTGGAKPGQTIHLNILRGGKENVLWSSTFGSKFHSLEYLGQATLR